MLETSLRDLAWVGDIAVAHESVVEHFAARKDITVVPMKMFTMFSSDDRALEEMRSRRRDILAAARRIAGCEEWGVRITRKPPVDGIRQSQKARPASGSAFLTAKKEARDVARDLVRAAVESAEQAYATLSALSRDARRRDDAPAGAAAPPLLDAAFLVPATAPYALQGCRAPACGGRHERRHGDYRHGPVARLQLRAGGRPVVSRRKPRPSLIPAAKPAKRPRMAPPPPRAQHPRPPKRRAMPHPHVAHIFEQSDTSLVDVIDNLLNRGVVLNADVILALANVDLVYLRLSALLCAADRVLPRGR